MFELASKLDASNHSELLLSNHLTYWKFARTMSCFVVVTFNLIHCLICYAVEILFTLICELIRNCLYVFVQFVTCVECT